MKSWNSTNVRWEENLEKYNEISILLSLYFINNINFIDNLGFM